MIAVVIESLPFVASYIIYVYRGECYVHFVELWYGHADIHARAISVEDTDWETIVSLYDALMAIRPSSVVALNWAIAIGEQAGPQRGLEAIRAISNPDRLASYPFCFAALWQV